MIIVKVPYRPYNLDWVREADSAGTCTNIDDIRLPERLMDAEVLTLHLKTGNMRVRLVDKQLGRSKNKPATVSFDVSLDFFNQQYQICEVK